MSKTTQITHKLQRIAGSIQRNRYISAISNGLMSTLPFLIIGAFSTLFTSLAWEPYQNLIAPVKSILGIPSTMTLGLISLYAVFFIAYRLAQDFDKDPLLPAATALASFLILTPVQSFDSVRALPLQWLGAQGLFVAMFVAIIASRLYIWILDKNWTIKMPEGVPPTVVKTFSGLIPAILISVLFMIIAGIFKQTSFETVHSLIYSYLQLPLQGLGGTLPAMILVLLVMQGLWMFGIHGAIVILAIMNPIWLSLDLANLSAFEAGEPLPNIIGKAFWFIFANYAPMIGLAFLLAFRAKSKQLRTIGKLGFPGSFFGIHEPILFGIPIVMNPILAIPFIASPIICAVIGYVLMATQILPQAIGIVPVFGTPVFVVGVLQGSWMLGVIQLLLIPLCMLIYYPFFKMLDKQMLGKELAAEKEKSAEGQTSATNAALGNA